MIHLFLAAITLATAHVAYAQPLILVPQVPVYTHGESWRGSMIDELGHRYEFRQKAERAKDTKVYLLFEIFDQGGRSEGIAIVDPQTWRMQMESVGVTMRIVSSTCSPDTLYPIVLGKDYRCSTVMSYDGDEKTIRSRMHFKYVHRKSDGSVREYCADTEDEQEGVISPAHVCFSADGKWMRSIQLFAAMPSGSAKR